MSKQQVHFAALAYEPFRMKPVHFATGFFLSLAGQNYGLEWLNKTSVTKHKDGLRKDYAHENLLQLLRDQACVELSVTEHALKMLRTQVNGVVDNDDGVNAAFRPYSTFGNDYTLVSDRFLTSERRLDGYSGHLAHRVLERSTAGQQVLEFARQCISRHGTPLEHLVEPLLDQEGTAVPWENPYPQTFGDLTSQRLDNIAALMEQQMRCQPRRAVRALTQMLIPHFHGATHQGREKVDYARIAAALSPEAVAAWFDGHGTDLNGLDALARSYLAYLRRSGATSGERLQQALGITNRPDFVEVDEYLVRLGLVTISAAGRTLTRDGIRYLTAPFDLRERISRQHSA
jgi:hypothetical protein